MTKGKITARTAQAAANKVRKKGYVVTKIKKVHKNHNIKNGYVEYKRPYGKNLYSFQYHRKKKK